MQNTLEHRSWGTTIDTNLVRLLCTAHARMNAASLSKQTGDRASKRWGVGVDFAELREYQPGDEIRHIDWRASARTRSLMTKRYVEDNDANVLFIIDLMGHMLYGTKKRLCSVTAAYLACQLAAAFRFRAYQVGLLWLIENKVQNHKPSTGSKLIQNLQFMSQSYNTWLANHAQDYIHGKQLDNTSHTLTHHIHAQKYRQYPRVVVISSMAAHTLQTAHHTLFSRAHQRIDHIRIYDTMLDCTPQRFVRLSNGKHIIDGSKLAIQSAKLTDNDCNNDISLSDMAVFATRFVRSPTHLSTTKHTAI